MTKRDPRIEHWDDERKIGNSLIVTLRNGWAFDPREREHVRGFDNAREANAAVKRAEVCRCPECRAHLYDEDAQSANETGAS